MWTLEDNEAAPDVVHYLPCGVDLLVSRRDGHILLPRDNSISRSHASLHLTHTSANLKIPASPATVQLTELGSKYGTFVNDGIEGDRKMPDRSLQEVKTGDRIRFGMLLNTWRLVHHSLVVTTSAVLPDSKAAVNKALLTLGGHVLSEWWVTCKYLVMDAITFTAKVVCALASGCAIVSPEFLTCLAKAVAERTPHPKPADYQPPLKEASISGAQASFSPDEKRGKILSGKVFLFLSAKQLGRMGLAVTLAGGITDVLSEANYEHLADTPTTHILVEPPPDKHPPDPLLTAATELLRSNKLSTVPESDIGLAILYISTEGYCNPAWRMANILKRSSSSQPITQGLKIYATETQEQYSTPAGPMTGARTVAETGQSTSTAPRPTPPTSSSVSLPPPSSSATATLASLPEARVAHMSSGHQDRKPNINTRKRPSQESSEAANPVVKRPNRTTPSRQPGQPNMNDSELPEENFVPPHASTQRIDGNTNKRQPNPFDISTTSTSTTAILPNDSRSSEILTSDTTMATNIGRSIPMVPYTLPTLPAETLAEVPTQPFVKEETASMEIGKEEEQEGDILDEVDFRPGKRRRNEGEDDLFGDVDRLTDGSKKSKRAEDKRREAENKRVDENDVSRDGDRWMGGSRRNKRADDRREDDDRRPEVTTNRALKMERLGSGEGEARVGRIKEEPQDLFALPTQGSGRRRQSNQVAAESKAPNGDLFALPASSRSQRRKGSESAASSTQEEQRTTTVKVAPVSESARVPGVADSPATPVSTARRLGEVEHGFISKKTASMVKRSPSDLETPGRSAALPNEGGALPARGGGGGGVPGDEGGAAEGVIALGEMMEKSMMVVEVASLVRSRPKPPTLISSTTSTSLNSSIINFKRFCKSGKISDISILPRIIGGTSLVPHDTLANTTRDCWLRDNPDLTRELAGAEEQMVADVAGQSSEEEEEKVVRNPNAGLFKLAAKPRRRRR